MEEVKHILELFDSAEKWNAFIELSNMREKLVYELKSRLVFELQKISEKYIANSRWEFFYDNNINIISIRPIDTPLIGIAIEWPTWNFSWSKRSAAVRIEANKIDSFFVFEKIKKNRHRLPMQDFEENIQNHGWFPFIKQIPANVFNVKDEISSFEECLYIANKNPELLANNLWKEVFEPFAKKEYADIMCGVVTQ